MISQYPCYLNINNLEYMKLKGMSVSDFSKVMQNQDFHIYIYKTCIHVMPAVCVVKWIVAKLVLNSLASDLGLLIYFTFYFFFFSYALILGDLSF